MSKNCKVWDNSRQMVFPMGFLPICALLKQECAMMAGWRNCDKISSSCRSSSSWDHSPPYRIVKIVFQVEYMSFGASLVAQQVKNAGDTGGSISGSGRSPGGGNGNPLQCSCLGNPMDRGAQWAIVNAVTKELNITERLNNDSNAYPFRVF